MARRRSAREVAVRVLHRVEREGAYLSLALDAELERSGLPAVDRGLATELCYGVLRRRSRLDRALAAASDKGLGRIDALALAILRVAAYQLLFLARVPAHAAVDEAVTALRRLRGSGLAGFGNAVLRKVAVGGEPALPEVRSAADLALVHALPAWMAERLVAQLGLAEAAACAEALGAPAPVGLRANTLRCTRAGLLDALGAELPGARLEASARAPDAVEVSSGGSPFATDAYRKGWFIGQDVGAQLVTRLLDPQPGERILDACSGLGGKTTYLAALTGNRAEVHAVDLSERKLELLVDHCRRLGVEGVAARRADLTEAGAIEGSFDRILLDAPCSGLGVLRRHPEGRWRRRPEEVTELAALQRRLLERVATALRPGGTLVYAVCTLTPEEGPDNVAWLLERGPDLSADAPLWLWPHRDGCDGFFAVRMRRIG